MADKIYSYAAGALIVEIPIQAEGPEMSFEFFAEEGCGLPAARVAGFLGAEQDKVFVGGGAGCEVCGWGESVRDGR